MGNYWGTVGGQLGDYLGTIGGTLGDHLGTNGGVLTKRHLKNAKKSRMYKHEYCKYLVLKNTFYSTHTDTQARLYVKQSFFDTSPKWCIASELRNIQKYSSYKLFDDVWENIPTSHFFYVSWILSS